MSLKACAICSSTKGLKRCVRCKNRTYCSVECQKSDWPVHREYCGLNRQQLQAKLDTLVDTKIINEAYIKIFKLCAYENAFCCTLDCFESPEGKFEMITRETLKEYVSTEDYEDQDKILVAVALDSETIPLLAVRTFTR